MKSATQKENVKKKMLKTKSAKRLGEREVESLFGNEKRLKYEADNKEKSGVYKEGKKSLMKQR